MCHDVYLTRERLKDEIARELLAEEFADLPGDEVPDGEDGLPAFLNEERDTEVELLTDE